jgi:pyrimidine-nucleoside phosphorylase
MISGRGLGHTGGTLDKLESIPGFNTQLSLPQFKDLVEKQHLAFIGQTAEICPADKKIYALRDVTGTVESLPLICASIMSKKLAEGIDALVLDVKCGTGAFMKTLPEAEALAKGLIEIAQSHGKKAGALITNMDQPLGRFAGNSLEVEECLDILRGGKLNALAQETRELSVLLAAKMVVLAGLEKTVSAARAKVEKVLSSGKAYDKFAQVCTEQGGWLNGLPTAKNKIDVLAEQSGFVQKMATEKIGLVGIQIHAGRAVVADKIEPTAGIEFHAKLGDRVQKGMPLFTLFGADLELLKSQQENLLKCVQINGENVAKSNLVWKEL